MRQAVNGAHTNDGGRSFTSLTTGQRDAPPVPWTEGRGCATGWAVWGEHGQLTTHLRSTVCVAPTVHRWACRCQRTLADLAGGRWYCDGVVLYDGAKAWRGGAWRERCTCGFASDIPVLGESPVGNVCFV
jgi:hypothetical protein